MDIATVVTLAKIDLGQRSAAYDEYLTHLAESAQQMIAGEGIVLTDDAQDVQLVVMYTAYLFRKRAEDLPAMPRMLRYALNNRLMAQKMGEGGT